jgi:hypothetical protein
MLRDFLKKNIKSQAKFVEWGYGQVEPNHLSAQRNAKVYAQLPADPNIDVLEQGQFVKYDYAKGLVNFTGIGEWMLVYNEIKLYREHQDDCEFALIKDNYQARIYSPFGGDKYGADGSRLGNSDPYTYDTNFNKQSRYYNGVDADGNDGITINGQTYKYDDVTASPDMYELHYNEDPFHIESQTRPQFMPEGTTMVPRVLKTDVGDIFTTNTIDEETLVIGDLLAPRDADGILVKVAGADGTAVQNAGATATMRWQVVKVYTMPDHQRGVKLMRVA